MKPWDYDFQGRPAGRLRQMARAQVWARANEHLKAFGLDLDPGLTPNRPWVVTGHQPELFHPGVWIKNFALAAIARQAGAVPLNLIVDNDIPKSSSIRVPHTQDGRLAASTVDFDAWSGEVPYEDWAVSDDREFATFGDRARETLGNLVADPILDGFWPLAIRAGESTDRVGLRFSAARRALEGSWGANNAEVPLGGVCETEAFGWFASHLLANLPRFQATHNAALGRYRALYRIRSKNHPVPLLTREGDWLESPFWAWHASSPRRRPLLARQTPRALELRIAGDKEVLGTLRLTPSQDACCAVEDLQDLARRGIRIRTRALTTTMFARLLLGDIFIHGIGGAKYDELGDEVIREFFGISPPDYLTLSLTQWLGLNAHPEAAPESARIHRAKRDLAYNPDRFLAESRDDAVRELIASKKAAILGPTDTRRQRVDRFRLIRDRNERLAAYLADEASRLEIARHGAEGLARDHERARSREWSFVLHSRSRLVTTMRNLVPSAFAPEKNRDETEQG